MHARRLAVALAIAAFVGAPMIVWAQAKPVAKVTLVPAKVTGDIPSQTATISVPTLAAVMPSVPGGQIQAQLRGVIVDVANAITMVQTSSAWIAITAPAGKYHLRQVFALDAASSTSSVSVHNGQLKTDPVVATCPISATQLSCDVIVTAPGGTLFLTSVIDAGGLLFRQISITPTTFTP